MMLKLYKEMAENFAPIRRRWCWPHINLGHVTVTAVLNSLTMKTGNPERSRHIRHDPPQRVTNLVIYLDQKPFNWNENPGPIPHSQGLFL